MKLRVHHIKDFIKALESEKFRENRYLRVDIDFDKKNGVRKGICYSVKEIEPMKNMLNSANNNTKVKIVFGMDDICKICAHPRKGDKICKSEDSLYGEHEKMLSPFEILAFPVVTIGFLKERYRIAKKYGSIEKWRIKQKRERSKKCRLKKK